MYANILSNATTIQKKGHAAMLNLTVDRFALELKSRNNVMQEIYYKLSVFWKGKKCNKIWLYDALGNLVIETRELLSDYCSYSSQRQFPL